MKMRVVLLATAVVVLVAASAALAEENLVLTDDKGIDLQMFRPSIFGGRYIAIEDSGTLCP
jgi:hypothetical protein